MNNFEIDKRAKELVDSETPYNLAKRVVELEDGVCNLILSKNNGVNKMSDKKCEKCNTEMAIDKNVLLTSCPPKPYYYCPECSPRLVVDVDIIKEGKLLTTYYPVAIEDSEQGWEFKVGKHNGIETQGNPTLERFVYIACQNMNRHVAEALYYAAWPEK